LDSAPWRYLSHDLKRERERGHIVSYTAVRVKYEVVPGGVFNIPFHTLNLSSSMFTTRAVIAQSVQLWAKGWLIGVLGFDSRG
jgi:hypothetical protein